MVRTIAWLVPALVALGLVVAVPSGQARAADAAKDAAKETPKDAGKGTVAGTVLDKENKPVASAQVRVMKPMARGEGRRGAGAGGADGAGAGGAGGAQPKVEGEKPKADAEKPAADAGGAGGGRGNRPPPVAQGETDKDGKFSIKDVPAGEYVVMAAVRGKGMGRAQVTVKANETATVSITLQDMPAGGGRRGGGAGGAGGGAGTGGNQ